MTSDGWKNKLTEDNKQKLFDKINSIQNWLTENLYATLEQYEDQKKEFESVYNPIVENLQQQSENTNISQNFNSKSKDNNEQIFEDID